ncbi:timeless protein-domain-containing protein [Hygrophoropsis aurantiaca]|uniref:Timeless protein-domain-containing protein n=1 Tax=Hygrophoropsis aurantiaca TaxID=72124 RepID=A0ACB8ABA5_9AGAM|nr:timeless protein-domain-containing protein [Hygrophoropsis aurantiaca]
MDTMDEEEKARRAVLTPVISGVVDALGGYESGKYRLGDSVAGCLRDLKKLWRLDDSDERRIVARIFWESRVFVGDLVPILEATAGQDGRTAVLCVDLMTAMTWPLDIGAELAAVYEDGDDIRLDYTHLQAAQVAYKAALVSQGLGALFAVAVGPVSTAPRARTERDGQIVRVVLHLIRNLACITDDNHSQSHSSLVRALADAHLLDLLVSLANGAAGPDPLCGALNTLVLEIFYLLFRAVKPARLHVTPKQSLHRLLALEEKSHRDLARSAPSRHSRFGTTVAVRVNKHNVVLHRQTALTNDPSSILDHKKRPRARPQKLVDPLARDLSLDPAASTALRDFATELLLSSFNVFLSSLLKDIKSERPKITESDHLRLLYVSKWMLEFFLVGLALPKSATHTHQWHPSMVAEVTDRSWIVWVLKRVRGAVEEKPKAWNEFQAGIECLTQLLRLIELLELAFDALKFYRPTAAAAQASAMLPGADTDAGPGVKGGGQGVAYLGASVALGYEVGKMVERWAGVRGGMYVRRKRARRRKTKKGKGRGEAAGEEEGGDGEGEGGDGSGEEGGEEEEVIHETMFTFEAFEMKFAQPEITRTLLAYLARWRDFATDSPDDSHTQRKAESEEMRRVVSLLHRQAVRAKAEGLFFNVSTLTLFKSILDAHQQRILPRDRAHTELVQLVNYILRQFFKALKEERMLAVEAFFPMNRGHWKQYSSWEPEKKSSGRRRKQGTGDDSDAGSSDGDGEGAGKGKGKSKNGEVQVKKGYSWSEQLGIAIAALVEEGKRELVEWVKDILFLVIHQRRKIVDETDHADQDQGLDENDGDVDDADAVRRLAGPSEAAISKFTDYLIPYISDEHADGATKNPRLKLMFRLLKFTILDENAEEVEWIVPAALLPAEMQSSRTVIDQFLNEPIDLNGQKASSLLSKKSTRSRARPRPRPRRRRRRATSSNPASDAELDGEDEEDADPDEPKRKREKRKREEAQYKSAQFIEDSEEEYGDIDAFLEREKVQREKAAIAAAGASSGSGTMRATGTKKRRRKEAGGEREKKKWKGSGSAGVGAGEDGAEDEVEIVEPEDGVGAPESDADDDMISALLRSASKSPSPAPQPKPKPKPKPKPRPRAKPKAGDVDSQVHSDAPQPKPRPKPRSRAKPKAGDSDEVEIVAESAPARRKGRVVVISDEDE